MTQALVRLTAEWASNFKVSKQVNSLTKDSIEYYDRARKSFELLAKIIADLWSVLGGLGKAFYDVGMEITNGIANMTSSWVVLDKLDFGSDGDEGLGRRPDADLEGSRPLDRGHHSGTWRDGNRSGEGSSAAFIYDLADALEGLSELVQAMAPLGAAVADIILLIGKAFMIMSEEGGIALVVIHTALLLSLRS